MMNQDEYVSISEFTRIVGCSRNYVTKAAAMASVRIRQVPGLPPRYHRGDVEALAAETYKVAGSEKKQAANQVAGRHPAAV